MIGLHIIYFYIKTTSAASNIIVTKENSSSTTEASINDNEVELLFRWEDYTVLAAMLIISCAIGVFYGYIGEKQTSSDDFLLGGSSMGTVPMALSLAARYVSCLSFINVL